MAKWQNGKRICRGDYRTDTELEYGTKSGTFFTHQPHLPTLPVPDLHSTLELYLSTVEPLATPDEFAHTSKCVAEFQEKEGMGCVLQERLQARAIEYEQSSWLQHWWNVGTYLAPRDPVPINVSIFYRFLDQVCLSVLQAPG